MTNEENSPASPESRETEISILIERLSALTTTSWVLEHIGAEAEAEKEIKVVLARLKELGVDPEAAIKKYDAKSE